MTTTENDTTTMTAAAAREAAALEPVLCIDCDQYVPLGWIDFLGVKCPKNFGATGVQYGHRVYTDTIQNIVDTYMNREK